MHRRFPKHFHLLFHLLLVHHAPRSAQGRAAVHFGACLASIKVHNFLCIFFAITFLYFQKHDHKQLPFIFTNPIFSKFDDGNFTFKVESYLYSIFKVINRIIFYNTIKKSTVKTSVMKLDLPSPFCIMQPLVYIVLDQFKNNNLILASFDLQQQTTSITTTSSSISSTTSLRALVGRFARIDSRFE